MRDLTNPAAVQQIKDARANKMGQLTPKPKTVVRVTAGPMAQGSGIRIVKGYVGSGEDYEGYGGKKHRHIEPPSNGNIFRHLTEDHGWDEGDFGRVADAYPTERTNEFARTLGQYHRNEHPNQADGFHMPHRPRPLSERRLAPRKPVTEDTHEHVRPDQTTFVHDHPHTVDHRVADHDGDPANKNPGVPDSLPDDIKNMKLDKSFDHEIRRQEREACNPIHAEETDEQAQEKMKAAHPPMSPGEFVDHTEARGTHSGLIPRSGAIHALPGYARHSTLTSQAGVKHSYGYLMSRHGWVRLSGSSGSGRRVDIELHHGTHNQRQREAAADVASYKAAHGGSVNWSCTKPGNGYGGCASGSDHESLLRHLDEMSKSRGLWLRTQAKGFEGRPMSLRRTKRGLAFRKSDKEPIDFDKRVMPCVTCYGTSKKDADPKCPDCKGLGRVAYKKREIDLMDKSVRKFRKSTTWIGGMSRHKCGYCDNKATYIGQHLYTGKGVFFCKKHNDEYGYSFHSKTGEQKRAEQGAAPARGQRLYDSMTRLANDPAAQPGERDNALRMRDRARTLKSMRLVVLVKSLSDWGNRAYSKEERASIESLPHNPSHVNSIMRHAARHVGPEDWKAGEAWHRGTHQTIEERTGGTPVDYQGIKIGRAPAREHIAEGISAMSPRQGWATGMLAFDKVHARETVGNSDNRGIGLGLSVRRARTALRGGGMGSGQSGRKTRALASASLIPTESHTDHTACDRELPIDVHADRVIHYGQKSEHTATQPLSGNRHEQHSNAFRVAAARMGKEPWALHFSSWVSKRRQLHPTNTGVRATMANETASGQPNVLRHTGLWPGSKRDPKLLMNSKTIWSKVPEGLRGEVKLGRMPRGDFARISSNARYLPAQKRLDVGPHTLRTRVAGVSGTIKRTRSEKDWTIAHELGHHMHSTRHQEMGARDWNALPDHEKAYLTSRFNGPMVTHYSAKDMGPEGLAEGYAHLFSGAFSSARLKTNAPQAHAMLTAKLDNAKKYWKSQAIYGAHASLEKGAGRSLLPAESVSIITMQPKPQGGGAE